MLVLYTFSAFRVSGSIFPDEGQRAYLGAIRGPVTLQQVLLKIVLMASENLHAPIAWRIRPHVPKSECIVLLKTVGLIMCSSIHSHIPRQIRNK